MKLLKHIIVYGLSAAVVVGSLAALTRLVEPKYDGGEYPLEGNFTAEYYDETTDHDVLMIGDCEVYENFDPMVLWKEYGITSYIRGNAQQLTWQSYYMLEDALRYETPKVVIYNVQALTHAKPEREEYNRMTLDGMRWSKSKWDAIQASMCKGEKTVEYLFPLLRYHSRMMSLGEEDLTYFFSPRRVTCNGYYMRIDTLPASEGGFGDVEWIRQHYPGQIDDPAEDGTTDDADSDDVDDGTGDADDGTGDAAEDEFSDPWADVDTSDPEEDLGDAWEGVDDTDDSEADGDEDMTDPWADVDTGDEDDGEESKAPVAYSEKDPEEAFGNLPMYYLDRIRLLCEEKGIRLILIKAPSLSPQWYDSQEQQVVDYAEKFGLPYINFYKLIRETGIDYETDTYDGGLHMNYSGAKKLSAWDCSSTRSTRSWIIGQTKSLPMSIRRSWHGSRS